MTDSLHYYTNHAQQYLDTTLQIDMSANYTLFLPYLSPGSSILDAGCGSGRDSLAFRKLGYQVEAFDACEAMVASARSVSQLPVRKLLFQELDYDSQFDGIWACASLLHVPRQELGHVFSLLAKALKPKGFLYCSFKNRDEDFSMDGRSFTCFTSDAFRAFVVNQKDFILKDLTLSLDIRPERGTETWINALLQKR
ncbi:MAG: class I SAM-dependent methyltransferase [Spirochaetia bacterium]|nr:class I SAM-dependent methyltransferase [Spirochaetia bacterium]